MDARDVLRSAINEIAGSVDWDQWPDELLAALDAAGFAMVPKEPTEAMIDAAKALEFSRPFGCGDDADDYNVSIVSTYEAAEIYKAMLAAAPKTEPR